MTQIGITLDAPAIITIYEVASVAVYWQQQCQQSRQESPISWDLSALIEFDGAGLQLLLITARQLGHCAIVNVQPPVNDQIAAWLMPIVQPYLRGTYVK